MSFRAVFKVSAIIAAAVLSGAPALGQALTKVSIALSSTSMSAAASRISKELGLFEKNGLDATVISADSSSVASSSLMSGSVNFTSTSPTEIVLSQARGIDMVALRSLHGGLGGVVVLAKAIADKSGVSPTAPVNERLKALDGLIIATPAATAQFTLALKPSAEAAGARIRFTYMDQQAMVAALETGVIQGFMASSPYYALPSIKGTGVIWINGPQGEFPAAFSPVNALTLNVMRSYAKANPDIIRRMHATYEDFADAVRDRPNDVKAAIAKLYPNVDPKALAVLFDSEAKGFRVKPLTVDDMAREAAWMKASGIAFPQNDAVKPESYVYP